MSIKKTASARWEGSLKKGSGTVSTESGVLSNASYDFRQRFEGEQGTNPEELIGAAHASCYSMALSMILGEAGMEPESIETRATVTLTEADDGFKVSAVHLETRARIPGAVQGAFEDAAEKAKKGCPISKLLNAEITLDTVLEGS